MTGTELIVLFAALGAAVAAVAIAVRRPAQPEADTRVSALLEAQSSRLDRLTDALGRQTVDDQELRRSLEATKTTVEEMRTHADARRQADEQTWDALRRLESMLLGGSTRGRAGENVLEEALSCLPAQMVVRDFPVNGKRVEFALVLPDGRRLPVDSKWAAVREVEALEAEDDPVAREPIARRLEDEVAKRAREVASYLEPSLTTPFAVACVPDAAYAACRKAHAVAFRHGVVIVGYSAALPVLLSLYALGSRYGQSGDVDSCLAELEGVLEGMEQTLENRVARATTMLQNAADEWRTGLGRARGAVARGRGTVALPEDGPRPLEAVE
ncbi:MAG TPA: DNA recombination protein RmuC [Actinomycetota bacterium]|nr:DNA recombination protein RmuC [Actinomycetota bacterium]